MLTYMCVLHRVTTVGKKQRVDDTLFLSYVSAYDLITYPNRVPTYRTSRSSIPIRLWHQRFSCMRGVVLYSHHTIYKARFFQFPLLWTHTRPWAPFLTSLAWKAKVVLPLLAPVLSAQTIFYMGLRVIWLNKYESVGCIHEEIRGSQPMRQ